MKSLFFLPFLTAMTIPAMAPAHFLWASLDSTAKTVSIGLTESPAEAPAHLGERIPLVKAWSAPSKFLKLKEDGTWLKAPFSGNLVAVSLNYGVLDKRDAGRGLFWLNYYAKAALNPEDTQTNTGIGVELSTVMVDGKPVVTVLYNGKPAPKAAITAEVPGQEKPFTGETATDGTITLPAISGPLAIRAQVVENVKGTEGGKDYEFRRSYGTLTVQNLGTRAMRFSEDKAYGLLEKASLARETMPKDVKEVSGTVEFLTEGRSLKAPFTFLPGSRATVDVKKLEAKDGELVESQVASLFNHRQSVPFANGNGKYALKVVSEDETGTLISVGDELNSTMKVKGDELVEVNRIMHGNRFIISTLETMRTPSGKSLPKIYAVSYFDPKTQAITKAQYFADAYTEVNGVWLPLNREIKTAEGGKISSIQLRFSDLKVTRG